MSSVTDTHSTRRLEDKTAVIFGAGGEVGGAVAKELAAQGARLFLSGRTKAPVQELAQAISSPGQTAAAAQVDALMRTQSTATSTTCSPLRAVSTSC